MFTAVNSPYLVPFKQDWRVGDASTLAADSQADKKTLKKELQGLVDELADLQRVLYADDRYSVLLIFQAMDAAGKDGTIRALLSGVNPAGCQVSSFKQPSKEELDHDFLWRSAKRLPERGRIGVFNRSYYEEVLVVRVHPEYLQSQKLPEVSDVDEVWQQRFESIVEHEQHLARNGTVIIKFWLNVSKDEQRNRFLSRLEEPEKNWKFSVGDVEERKHWDQYMEAYEQALSATSKPWAPWYAIPADNKHYMRAQVASIVVDTIKHLELSYPQVDDETRRKFSEMRGILDRD